MSDDRIKPNAFNLHAEALRRIFDQLVEIEHSANPDPAVKEQLLAELAAHREGPARSRSAEVQSKQQKALGLRYD